MAIADRLVPKVVSARTHGVIDYVHAGTNFAAAAFFRNRNPRASSAALFLGLGVLANALLTDYELGVFRAYSFRVHGILDYGVAAISEAMPGLLGIQNSREAGFFTRQGVAETILAALTNYKDDSGATRTGRGRRLRDGVRRNA